MAHYSKGDLPAAAELFRQVEQALRKFGRHQEHPDISRTINNLAVVACMEKPGEF
jgi:hypothetical protein